MSEVVPLPPQRCYRFQKSLLIPLSIHRQASSVENVSRWEKFNLFYVSQINTLFQQKQFAVFDSHSGLLANFI